MLLLRVLPPSELPLHYTRVMLSSNMYSRLAVSAPGDFQLLRMYSYAESIVKVEKKNILNITNIGVPS